MNNKVKQNFIISFSTIPQICSYYDIHYVLKVDTSSFASVSFGKERFLIKEEIEFLYEYVYPVFDIFEYIMDKKIRSGKYYIFDYHHYDFHLSSKWSKKELIKKITRRLDALPYVIDVLGTKRIKWDHK